MTTLVLKDATPCPLCVGEDGKATGRVRVESNTYALCSCPEGERAARRMAGYRRPGRDELAARARADEAFGRRTWWRRVRDWLGV